MIVTYTTEADFEEMSLCRLIRALSMASQDCRGVGRPRETAEFKLRRNLVFLDSITQSPENGSCSALQLTPDIDCRSISGRVES